MMQPLSHVPHPKPLDVAEFDPFLAPGPVIDCDHLSIQERAEVIAYGAQDDREIARACFEWVRDEIHHTADIQCGPVTCKASDVLRHGAGFCFAKSHLLAALLRANAIPAGLCYQRLADDDAPGRFILHGLVAVHLPRFGWYRIDPRGNKPGIDTQFTPPNERLAWKGDGAGEVNFRDVWATPMPEVVSVLETSQSWQEVMANLPDCDPNAPQ